MTHQLITHFAAFGYSDLASPEELVENIRNILHAYADELAKREPYATRSIEPIRTCANSLDELEDYLKELTT